MHRTLGAGQLEEPAAPQKAATRRQCHALMGVLLHIIKKGSFTVARVLCARSPKTKQYNVVHTQHYSIPDCAQKPCGCRARPVMQRSQQHNYSCITTAIISDREIWNRRCDLLMMENIKERKKHYLLRAPRGVSWEI